MDKGLLAEDFEFELMPFVERRIINMKKMEKISKMRYKAINGKEDYMFITCSEKKATAAMNGLEETCIKNAMIIIQSKDESLVWRVKNGHIEQSPRALALCTKNMGNLVGLVGDVHNEADYFSFGGQDEADLRISFIIGAVEISGYCIAFLFDWNSKMVYSIEEDIWQGQDSHLFVLLEAMRNLERRNQFDEQREYRTEDAYGYKTNVQKSSWEEEV